MADEQGRPTGGAPPAKKLRTDGNLNLVDKSVLQAAQDPEQWIANRRKNWPTKERIAQKQAEAARQQRARAEQGGDEDTATPIDAAAKQQQPTDSAGQVRKPPICRYFLKGRCKAGQKCRFTHAQPASDMRPQRPAHERVYKRFEPPTKASLFVKLVQTDHDAEDEKLLDFIEYMYQRQLI